MLTIDATCDNNNNPSEQQTTTRKTRLLAKGIHRLGNALQKINIGRWIDELEHDQELADDLEVINAENAAQTSRLDTCRAAHEA